MVKQKIVIKLSIENAQKRTKVLRAAVGIDGTVTSTSMDGDKIVVEGESIDSITLTTTLRKKLGYAELISVAPVEEKKKEEKKEEQPIVLPHYYAVPRCIRAITPMKLANLLILAPSCD